MVTSGGTHYHSNALEFVTTTRVYILPPLIGHRFANDPQGETARTVTIYVEYTYRYIYIYSRRKDKNKYPGVFKGVLRPSFRVRNVPLLRRLYTTPRACRRISRRSF